jgi:sporulation protein YlmC with PRC-barrel domain
MTFPRTRASSITTGMLLLLATGWAEAQQPQPTPPAVPAAQPSAVQVDATSVVGSVVRSSQGRDIGRVSRLMLDPREGRVTTIVITMGGMLGIGGETLSVPWNAVRVGQDGRNLVLIVDQQILESVPAASPRTGNQGQPTAPKTEGQPKQ